MSRMIKAGVSFGLIGVICLVVLFGSVSRAQEPKAAVNGNSSTAGTTAVPPLMQFSGVLKDKLGAPLTGVRGVTFALYREQSSGSALWIETQNVVADAEGRFVVLLGATSPSGLPIDLFTTGLAQWLGLQAAGQLEQPRTFLSSVPYALASPSGTPSNSKGGEISKLSTADTRTAAITPGIPPRPVYDIVTAAGSGLQSSNDANGTVTLSLNASCAPGQLLKWNGIAWGCATDSGGGDITAVNTPFGGGLTGGVASGDANLSLVRTCGINELLKFNGNEWFCAADTWFPGFRWQHASCSECHVHLGWYFDRGDEYFYGLILNRIQHD